MIGAGNSMQSPTHTTRMATRRWPALVVAALRSPRPVAAPSPPRLIGPLLALASAALYLLTCYASKMSRDGGVMYDTTQAIVNRHTLAMLRGQHGVPGVHAAFYSKYGIAQSVAEIPLYLVGRAVAPHVKPPLAQVTPLAITMLTNPIIMALAVWMFFLLAYALSPHLRSAVLAAALLAVASPYWPYAKTDFSEPLLALAFTGAVLFLVRARAHPTTARFALSGLFVALAMLTKITALLALPAIGLYALYVATTDRGGGFAFAHPRTLMRRLLAWGLPVLAGVALVAAYNLARYGRFTDTGYRNQNDLPFHAPLLQGLGGLLISPGKGLLLFCPLVVIALLLWLRFLRRRRAEGLLALGIVLPTLVIFATYPVWWGGVCWGPRYLVPLLPLLLLPLVFLLEWLPRIALLRRAVMTVIGLSVLVQFLGVAVHPNRFPASTGLPDHTMQWTVTDSPLLSQAWLVAYDVTTVVDRSYAAEMLHSYPWHHPAGTSLSQRINVNGWPFWWWQVLGQNGLDWQGVVAIVVALLVVLSATLWPLWRLLRAAEESPYDHWHMAVPASSQ